MSLLRTFERASSCTLSHDIASQSLFAFLCPALHKSRREYSTRRRASRSKPANAHELPSAQHMDNIFITALVRAGACQEHGARPTNTGRPTALVFNGFGLSKARRKASAAGEQKRQLHTKTTRPAGKSISAQTVSKEALHNLVDIYGTREEEGLVEWGALSDSIPVGPEALHQPWEEMYFPQKQDVVLAPSFSEASSVVEDMKRLLEDPNTPHEELYRLYQQLPADRIHYLPNDLLSKFVRHVSVVPASRFQRKNAASFLSLLHDMRAANITTNLALWTTAIRYTGLSDGAQEAVSLWREMEQQHGLKANNYTFSILFDLAVKGQNFALAEMIEHEAQDRQIQMDRISRMSRIFYYGILGDGRGVRRAYAQLVDAGEIVDTAVLTNVITSLIDADELPAAEETFERMKRLHAEKQGATEAPHNWRQSRELRRLLVDAGHRYRDRVENRKQFQDAAPINPDWKTYRAFIRYHAIEAGAWDRVEQLLDEMRTAGLDLNREIYSCLFSGFAKHGGIRLAMWNRRNLERTWNAFERSCVKDPVETFLDATLAVTIIKAFTYCTDSRRARVIWETMLERWTPPSRVRASIEQLLSRRRSKYRI